jgi:hypothetical protein
VLDLPRSGSSVACTGQWFVVVGLERGVHAGQQPGYRPRLTRPATQDKALSGITGLP